MYFHIVDFIWMDKSFGTGVALKKAAQTKESFVDRNNRKLLVTERNGNIRDLLRREFAAEGFEVDVAADASSLRDLLESGAGYALAVLDEDLPNAGAEPVLDMCARLAPEMIVILHVFPGGERGGEAGASLAVEKSGDFAPLKSAVIAAMSKNPAQPCGERGR